MKNLIALAAVLISSLSYAQVPHAPAGLPAKVPAAESAASKGETITKQAGEKALVHINSASVEDLQKLPGIGTEKAKAIVAARPFKSVDDLKKVKGIKEAVFSKIKGMVTL